MKAAARIASAITCLVIFSFTISLMLPLLALTLEERGTSPLIIGILGAITGGGILISAPLAPAITRRFGASQTVLLMFVITAACFIGYKIWEDSLTVWFLLRTIAALAGGLIFVIAEAAITATAPAGKRGVVLGIYAAGFSFGFALGPLVIAVVGIQGWTPYIIAAIFTLAPSILVCTVGIGTLPDDKKTPLPPFISLFRSSPLPFLCAFAVGACETTIYDLLPPYARKLGLEISAAAVLLTVLSVGAVILQMPFGIAADRLGNRRMLIAFSATAVIGALSLPWIITGGIPGWFFLGLWSAGIFALYPIGLSEAVRQFETQELISVNALFGFCYGIGALIVPIIAGAAMILSPHALGAVLAATMLMILICTKLLENEKKNHI